MHQDSFIYKNFEREQLPHFGFKIHISATFKNYMTIRELILPFLNKKKVAYKFLKDEQEVLFNFSHQETLAEAGKYFTIYPSTRNICLELLEELYQLIPANLDGIYIMSDRAYKDSKTIFYRFGTIKKKNYPF